MNLLGTNFRLHNKRLIVGLAALLALALLLAACGAEEAEEAPTEPAPVDTPASETSSEEAEAEPEMAADAGTLRVAMQPMAATDPAFISSDSEVLVANHVYDYLVDVDPQSNITPRLATEWQVSDDGLSYTFSLAEGASWHDGDPFTAEDVIWTFNRLRDPELGSPTVDLYSNIADIQASGDLEVTFSLAQPNPFFLYDLSDNHALVVKNGTTDATDFNGTGPFMVDSYSPEDRISLVANDNYFVDGQPRLSAVEVIFFNDETAAVDALRGGQIDLAMRMSTSLFESLQQEDGIIAVDIPTNGFDLVRLRADQEPGNNPQVLQALKLATDREAILQLVQQGYGAVGNDSPIGPLYEAYHADDVTPPARDVAAAQALLAEAGYGDGLDLVLYTPDTGGRPDLAAVLQSQWAEAGVNVEINVVPESVYYSEDPNNWLDANLGITGWGSRPYPQFYLDVMLVCGAKWNESHFCDEEFDALAKTAGTTQDEAERIVAYRGIQELLADRGPVIIPYYFAQFAAISDQFENFELKAFAGRTDFRDVQLAQ
ncbi:MAG: ABC transporter substrate-binding protein [Chloroflexota bacterium]|jgi:peptide/nickel transport system substrate-binding protein